MKDYISRDEQICFLFSGQGSQYYGMAKCLYKSNNIFRECMERLDYVVKSTAGYSVIYEMYESGKGMSDSFQNIVYTHPAIFMVEYSLAELLIDIGIMPDYLIGSSLGESVAYAVSGLVTPESMLALLVRQAFLLHNHCKKGGMITVLENEQVYNDMLCDIFGLELAAVDYDKHFVISGDQKAISEAQARLKKNHINYVLLPVDYGFHSSSIDEIKEQFCSLDKKLVKGSSWINVYSSADVEKVTSVTTELLWNVIRKKIRFQDTIKKLDSCNKKISYIDLGPSGTLASMSKEILQRTELITSIISPFHTELKNIDKVIGENIKFIF